MVYNVYWTLGTTYGALTLVGVAFTQELVSELRARGYSVEVEAVRS